MSRQPRIRDVVTWRPPSKRSRGLRLARNVLGGLVWAFGAAIDLASNMVGGASQVDSPNALARKRLPCDPHEEISGFECKVVDGNAAWVPSRHADPAWLRMSATAVWITPPGLPRRIELDVEAYRLVQLTPDDQRLGPADRCVATITGQGVEFRISGPWLAVAWLGHLGGWPDPRSLSTPLVP
ncbi:hypothetical protein [Streptomyces sp.]|uniref:hypothetical protein n=1 Tax=Streptomyces sp. TaxID=1931 RepID=UPI00281177F2|nr:hypothetical protein [Streptomyces sp.]